MSRGIKLPDNPSEWGFKGKNFLLTIGIDDYQHWKPLHNAVKDVRDLTQMLTERYQFSSDDVVMLFNEAATEDQIRQTLLEVKRSISPEDNLILYFSGHGHYDLELDEGYWVPANARVGNPSDYISNSDVLKWVRAIKTHHTLIVVDSCFSGTLVSHSRSAILSEKYPSCRIFASGRKELVEDGAPGTNSPFAKALLSRLSRNTDRTLRASELIQAVTKVVESEAGQAPVEGRLKDAGDEGGEFVFHLKVTESDIWASVINSNSAEEYAKYIDYFPDGMYLLEAKTKLSELTDDSDWRNAMGRSSPAALTEYLEAHPRGKYYAEAFKKLEELEENDTWQSAKTKNAVTGYMDYLRKYPTGRFAGLARKNIDAHKNTLQQPEQELMEDELEDIQDGETKTVDRKTQFKEVMNEAEGLFAKLAYTDCIRKYEVALSLYQQHYVPDKRFIEQRIKSATTHLTYLEHLEDGKRAVTEGNYALALEFFKKARSVDDTPKIREWITHAEQKRRGDFQFTQVKGTVSGTQGDGKQKKKSSLKPLLWVLGVVVLGVIVVAVIAVVSSVNDLNHGLEVYEPAKSDLNYDPVVDSKSEDLITTREPAYVPPPKVSVRTLVSGTWNVHDRSFGGYSVAATGVLAPASWVFYKNGSLAYWENGVSVNGTWTLNEGSNSFTSVISIPNLGITAYISEIDDAYMTIVSTEMLGQFTNYLVRVD
jgi:hypothetical protein